MRFKSTDPLVRTVIDLGIPALGACIWFWILLSPPTGWDTFPWQALVTLTPLGIVCVLLLALFWSDIWTRRKRRKQLLEAEFEAPVPDRVFQWRDVLRITCTMAGAGFVLYVILNPAWYGYFAIGVVLFFVGMMAWGAVAHRRFSALQGRAARGPSSPAQPDDGA